MPKTMKLECTATALVDGEPVRKGTVEDYPEATGRKLLASGRFRVPEPASKSKGSGSPKGAAKAASQ